MRVVEQLDEALEYARQARSSALELQALGGLCDANYLRGSMVTANELGRECVDLAESQGLEQVAAANLGMVALTAIYRLHIQTAIVDGRRALAEADRCGLPRAAIVAHQASAYALFESANWGAAEAECAAALGKARELGAIRFASISEHLLSEIYRLQGHKEAARSAASKAWEVSKATGPMFTGPHVS